MKVCSKCFKQKKPEAIAYRKPRGTGFTYVCNLCKHEMEANKKPRTNARLEA